MMRVVRVSDAGWPAGLNEGISPLVESLHAVGRPLDIAAPMVAVVGTRRPTAAGLTATREITSELALAGYTIVSGLAVGIDAMAHRAALDVGGRTVAVLGCGHSIDYPKRNRTLRRALEQQGTVLSEYAPETEPKPWMFPLRNRIIAGLTLATIVIEGTIKSGALVTARLALDANREVFAVPGSVRNVMAEGPNELIRRGEAALVTNAGHVLEGLSDAAPRLVAEPRLPTVDLSDAEQDVLAHLDDVPDSVDAMVDAVKLPLPSVTAALSMLELYGLARRTYRGYVITDEGSEARRALAHQRPSVPSSGSR